MLPTTPIAILQRHTAKLRSHLPGLLDGRPDSIHDARIATRRIREVLPLTDEWQRRKVTDELSTRFKRMGRSLGRVRDADVRMELLRYLESRVPTAAAVLVPVRQSHEVTRLLLVRKLVKRLERLELEPELVRLENGAERQRGRFWLALTGTWRGRLRRLVTERAQAATDAIAHATGVYFPNRTHEVRIALKTFRYAAEIAAETGILVDPALLRDLKKTQDVLGELHDRQTLVDDLSARRSDVRDADADYVRLVIQVLEAETGDRHQRFLARRVRVLDDCERAQRGVRRMQPSAAALAAAGAVALTGLEALRRQRSARPVRAAAGESRSRDAAATGPVRMPVTLADSRAQSR